MKGIVLAGGSGTRLYPSTISVNKQLLPIYDKPMIYYPISTLMLSGIKEILIISTPTDIDKYKYLLGDGSKYGLRFEFMIQPKPEGLSQAFIIGEDFIKQDDVTLILGDNIFYGNNLPNKLKNCVKIVKSDNKAVVLGYYVNDPKRYGVIDFNKFGKPISIEEKPNKPKSNYAVAGIYFYPNDVVEIAKKQKPSKRNELEITDTNSFYLSKNRLAVKKMSRGFAWLDTGTIDSLLEASLFVQTIEKRQGMKISCIEEIAYRMNYITKKQLEMIGSEMKKNEYGKYLLRIAQSKSHKEF